MSGLPASRTAREFQASIGLRGEHLSARGCSVSFRLSAARLALIASGALGAASAAALVVEYEAAVRNGDTTLVHASPPAPGSATPPPSQAPDFVRNWTTVILARPLFDPNRRPAAEAKAGSSPALNGLPRLAGVLVSPTGRIAIFAGSSDGKPTSVSEGGKIGPFTVENISAGQVVVRGSDGTRTLHPSFAPVANSRPLGGLRTSPAGERMPLRAAEQAIAPGKAEQ